MAKHARTTQPIREEHLDTLQRQCAVCGGALWQQKTKWRSLVTLEGVVRLHLTLRSCRNPACARFRRSVRPEAEGRLVLPKHEVGLDVIAQIGTWRYREHRSVPEMHTLLQARGLPISQRSVTNLLQRYDELIALQLADRETLRAATQLHGRVVLALDGLQPDVGHEVLWVLRDCLSGMILLARSMLSATTDDLTALLIEVKTALDVPISSVISDGQTSIRRAVAQALPGVPHQLCHFHYLREAAKDLSDADRHAKKELKKQLRGIRPIERQVDGSVDPTAQVAQAYCVALRSALTDDGPPPLAAPGLRLYDRVSTIAASLDRLAQKGGCPNRWSRSSAWWRGRWRRQQRTGRR